QVSGGVSSNGGNGGDDASASGRNYGGAGAGGSVLIKVQGANLGPNLVNVNGGSIDPQAGSGSGGLGRIRVDYCDTLFGLFSSGSSSAVNTSLCPIPTPPPTSFGTATPTST